jgi:hypothetical protein
VAQTQKRGRDGALSEPIGATNSKTVILFVVTLWKRLTYTTQQIPLCERFNPEEGGNFCVHLAKLHGDTTQKATICKITAVETSGRRASSTAGVDCSHLYSITVPLCSLRGRLRRTMRTDFRLLNVTV